jgi:hypothetical protein
MTKAERAKRIAELNDNFRANLFTAGRTVMTAGVNAKGERVDAPLDRRTSPAPNAALQRWHPNRTSTPTSGMRRWGDVLRRGKP